MSVRGTLLKVIKGGRGSKPLRQVIDEGQARVKRPGRRYAKDRPGFKGTSIGARGIATAAGVATGGALAINEIRKSRKKK